MTPRTVIAEMVIEVTLDLDENGKLKGQDVEWGTVEEAAREAVVGRTGGRSRSRLVFWHCG